MTFAKICLNMKHNAWNCLSNTFILSFYNVQFLISIILEDGDACRMDADAPAKSFLHECNNRNVIIHN